jgi:release factor glutamine methyltransferase
VTEAQRSWTVGEILTWTTNFFTEQEVDSARLDAEVLVAHALGVQRVDLYVRYTMPLGEDERAAIRSLIRQRARDKTPVAYLVGHREFYGIDLQVTRDVLIPRPCTEALVDVVLDHLKASPDGASVLDVGTGSGAIALAVAKHIPTAIVTATDISPEALQIAKQNAAAHDLSHRISFLESDMFAKIDGGTRFDVVVSNPPYVDPELRETLMPDVRDHEPGLALYAPESGLYYIQHLLDEAPNLLNDGGLLALELAPDTKVLEVMKQQSSNPCWTHIAPVREIDGHTIGLQVVLGSATEIQEKR